MNNHDFKVGDILSASWGHEQTNWDFYRVEKATSTMVYLVQLQSVETDEIDENGIRSMTGTAIPTMQTRGKSIRRKVKASPYRDENDCFVMINEYTVANRWSGNPKRYTCYA